MTQAVHRIYLIPGMFGFGRLAGYEYFEHLERAICERFAAAGIPAEVHGIPSLPTASIRRRAAMVGRAIAADAAGTDGPIHLIGHSTGGLDARLLASPGARLRTTADTLRWTARLRTVVTINTPHYGTPLAKFFATVSGMRLLYALSLLSVATLSLGSTPLSAIVGLTAGLGSLDERFGIQSRALERIRDAIVKRLGAEEREEFRMFMDGVRYDQGGILQLAPECMDLFNSAVSESPDVDYCCVASSAPPPKSTRVVRAIRSPYAALSAAIYSTLHSISGGNDKRYPYADVAEPVRVALRRGVGHRLSVKDSDGVVPTFSMLWGDLLWCGSGDHLDVVGHFRDDVTPATHIDWLASGSAFDRARFSAMADALTARLASA